MDGLLFAMIMVPVLLSLKPLDVLFSNKKEEPAQSAVNFFITLMLFAVFSAVGKTDISTHIGCCIILVCALVQGMAAVKALMYRPSNKKLS